MSFPYGKQNTVSNRQYVRGFHFILYFFLCLYSATSLASTYHGNARPDCKTVKIAENSNTLLTLRSIAIDKDKPVILHSTEKYYPYVSQTCIILQNTSDKALSFAFYAKNPRAVHAELVQLLNEGDESSAVVESVAGIAYPLDTWKKLGDDIIFTVEIPAASTKTYELNITASSPYFSQLQIFSFEKATEALSEQQTITGILAGIILALIIYAMFLAISHRDITYFFLAGSTTAVAMMQLSDLGVLYPLWPKAIIWNQICTNFFAVWSTITGTAMLRNYLITAQAMPRSDKVLKIYVAYLATVALPVSIMVRHDLVILLYGVPALGLMIAIISLSIIRIRQGYTPAKLYLIAVMLPIMTGTITFMNYTGIMPTSPLMHLLPLAGTSLQLVLFALALGERINWLDNQQKIVREQALAAQTETSAKKNFLARISHELRTPLSGIIGLAELAQKKSSNLQDDPLIVGLEDSARHLLETTNMLLDHARIDAGKWPLANEFFSLRELLEDIINQHRTSAGYKSLGINCQIHPNVPERINSDPEIVRRILDYIINNAIKFTHDGGITLMVESTPIDRKQVSLRIDILDTGIGFDELFKARAFELFELADMSTTRIRQGFGLGLSLSKKLCQLLGGEIGCESNPKHGTVFWFILPCTIDDTAINPARPAQHQTFSHSQNMTIAPDASMALRVQQRRSQQAKRLLLAEDDETLGMIIGSQLEKLQQPFTLYPNGKPLIAEYRRHHADIACLLLDWNMPICNAEQTITEIRQFEYEHRLPPVPVIIMSAYDKQSAKELRLPADACILHKPVTIDDLAHLLFPDPDRTTANHSMHS